MTRRAGGPSWCSSTACAAMRGRWPRRCRDLAPAALHAGMPGPRRVRRGPRRLSIATFAEDVAALIEDAAGGPVRAGRHLDGGGDRLRLAVTRPDLVRALVLVRPAWVTDAGPANMAPNAEVGALLAPPARRRGARGVPRRRRPQRRLRRRGAGQSGLADWASSTAQPSGRDRALLTAHLGRRPGVTPSRPRAPCACRRWSAAPAQDAIHPAGPCAGAGRR